MRTLPLIFLVPFFGILLAKSASCASPPPPGCLEISGVISKTAATFKKKYKDYPRWTRPQEDTLGSTQAGGLRSLQGHQVALLTHPAGQKDKIVEGLVVGVEYQGSPIEKIAEPFLRLQLAHGKLRNIKLSEMHEVAVAPLPEVSLNEFKEKFGHLKKYSTTNQNYTVKPTESFYGKKIAVLIERDNRRFAVVGEVTSSLYLLKNSKVSVFHETLSIKPEGLVIPQNYNTSEILEFRVF